LRYSDFDGDWEKFLATVYQIFERDFKQSRPSYRGLPLDYDSRSEEGKEAVFWHLTSRYDKKTGNREMDLRRCERMPWPSPIIERSQDKQLSVWKNKRGKEIRILLWLEAMDYLVVLKESRHTVILVTAYCTDRDHTRDKLRSERKIGFK
jgi:hypothetical protein